MQVNRKVWKGTDRHRSVCDAATHDNTVCYETAATERVLEQLALLARMRSAASSLSCRNPSAELMHHHTKGTSANMRWQ